MRSKLSILGLYNYRPDIFDNMTVPAGVVKSRVIDTILMECAELGLTYANPDTMKLMIKTWSYNKLPAWERIWTALEESYDPLHNYDRHEDWTDSKSGSASGTAGASGSNSTKVAGFNQATPSMTDRDSSTQSTSSSSSSNSSEDGTHKGHIYGNIGVTTSAQMLQGEIDVRLANDMYNIICQSFKTQFCIQIY